MHGNRGVQKDVTPAGFEPAALGSRVAVCWLPDPNLGALGRVMVVLPTAPTGLTNGRPHLVGMAVELMSGRG